MTRVLTCREFVEFLDEYVAGSLPPDRVAEFNSHLAQCPSCVAYMKTYRTSIALGRSALAAPDGSVPEDVPESLVRAILAAREKT
jgi:anti-sigma factor RsiW